MPYQLLRLSMLAPKTDETVTYYITPFIKMLPSQISGQRACDTERPMNNIMTNFDDLIDEYEFLEGDERYRMLIELGRSLEDMPDALKTDATLVRGCSAQVWVYPANGNQEQLHFLADSNAAITKGIIALVLAAIQDKSPANILAMDIAERLAPFDLKNQLSSNRTQGIPNMIALIRETAARYAQT